MRLLPAALLDLLCVAAFVLIGRSSHGEENALLGFLGTAWPFAAALAAGWLATLAWRAPARPLRTGAGVWAVTVAGGMVLRVLSGGGAPLSFVIVTAVFLGLALVGWRTVAHLVSGRRDRRSVRA
ncbi:DUF3054 domain-containing protein [Marinitenerispora sediminis]|uniref:DUF3054 domain-containing protein n=1 Tax=Marinitenerispora sediminis TaxID=1931232 RepID=A0A368T8M5_9ACTN|nr:DUF3054 domain-containing protein [Marinitenerispora sediminis]RCV53600.1 DUF3054 domain-containing protein [Marinitenerispora sediminis]RCV55961.1 DUF3054 domain-containing protein [Marinitenerispora sediminis]RCV60671.1 DUF3054 domain-containing protein [Marinitenerispora sediminis]